MISWSLLQFIGNQWETDEPNPILMWRLTLSASPCFQKPPIKYDWMVDHMDNKSGTDQAYMPYSTTKSMSKVESWTPGKKWRSCTSEKRVGGLLCSVIKVATIPLNVNTPDILMSDWASPSCYIVYIMKRNSWMPDPATSGKFSNPSF